MLGLDFGGAWYFLFFICCKYIARNKQQKPIYMKQTKREGLFPLAREEEWKGDRQKGKDHSH
jgi:hypothetical protein